MLIDENHTVIEI